MNRFTKKSFKDRISGSFSISLIIFVLILGLFIYGISTVSNSDVVNDKEILEEAVLHDVVHCYSVEGMYPPSVTYMEDHYGLTYDKDKFIIDYQFIGANIMPQVEIIKKSGNKRWNLEEETSQ